MASPGSNHSLGADVLTTLQLKMAKAALGWSNADVAERAGVHKNTVNSAENGRATQPTLAVLQQVLEAGGVVFVAAGDGLGEGVRLRQPSDLIVPMSRTRARAE